MQPAVQSLDVLHRHAAMVKLVEEPDDLACDVLSPRLLVVHDTCGSGEDDVTELTRWQKLDDPLLHVDELDVVARANHAGLVDAVGVSEATSSKSSGELTMHTGH